MKDCLHKIECFPSLQKMLSQQQNGEMIPLWSTRSDPFQISYVYAMTLFPRTLKGPYQHLVRTGRLFLLSGKALLVHRKPGGEFCEDYLTPLDVVDLPAKEEYCLIGMGQEVATFINLCDFAWTPGNTETIVPDFSKYDFSQWGIR